MKVSLGWAFVVAFAVTYFSAFFGVQWALGAPALVPGDPRTGQVSKVYAPHASSGSDPDGLPDAVAPGRAAAPPAAAPAPVAPAAPAPAAPRAVALFVSSCPRLTDAAVRRVVAVELGARLIATGAAAPADVDRVLIGCNGQVARIEAGDPATPRYAERTLPLDQFRGDAAARAVGLAALELLAALDHLRPPPPKPVAHPAAAAPPANNAAVDAYQQDFVWFYDSVTVGMLGRSWVPYRGKYHQPLAGGAFYKSVGRPDLESRYTRWRALQIGMVVGGIGASLYGMTRIQGDHTLGGGLFLGGALAVFVGFLIDPDPVGESEARQLADAHNKALKRRLGLTSDEPMRPAEPTPVRWRLAAGLAPGAGSLGVTLNF